MRELSIGAAPSDDYLFGPKPSPWELHEAGPAVTGWGEAWFSHNSRYRWRLRRTWGTSPGNPGRLAVFVCLNPSTAGACSDDPTLRRGVGYAHREGCAGVEFVNLSPRIATRPVHMLKDLATYRWPPPWFDDNMTVIRQVCSGAADPQRPQPLVILAWGANASHKLVQPLAAQVRDWLAFDHIGAWALGFTGKGEPLHPLMLRADAPLIKVTATVAW